MRGLSFVKNRVWVVERLLFCLFILFAGSFVFAWPIIFFTQAILGDITPLELLGFIAAYLVIVSGALYLYYEMNKY